MINSPGLKSEATCSGSKSDHEGHMTGSHTKVRLILSTDSEQKSLTKALGPHLPPYVFPGTQPCIICSLPQGDTATQASSDSR